MNRDADLLASFDGGGTKTECLVSDGNGNILGRGMAGPSNYHNVGLDGALEALGSSFEQATFGLQSRPKRVRACYGLAGLDSPADMRIVTEGIASLHLGPAPLVVNDWRTALAGAFMNRPGIVVISGTGCVAAAQDGRGRVVKVGGWGDVIDDKGSSYDIGREALYAAMRDYDSRGPHTALLRILMDHLRVEEPEGLIERVYVNEMDVSQIASLCTLVSAAAASGDAVSRKILREKGALLGELAVKASELLGLRSPKISMTGGTFNSGAYLVRSFRKAIRDAVPDARFLSNSLSPACGGLILLLQVAGVKVDGHLERTMRNSPVSTS